jgi:hypothetical protein
VTSPCHHVGDGRLVVTTGASQEPVGLFERYQKAFRGMGLRRIVELPIGRRGEARDEDRARRLDGNCQPFSFAPREDCYLPTFSPAIRLAQVFKRSLYFRSNVEKSLDFA